MSDNKVNPTDKGYQPSDRPPNRSWPSNKNKSNDDNKGGKSFQDYLDDATKKDQGKKK